MGKRSRKLSNKHSSRPRRSKSSSRKTMKRTKRQSSRKRKIGNKKVRRHKRTKKNIGGGETHEEKTHEEKTDEAITLYDTNNYANYELTSITDNLKEPITLADCLKNLRDFKNKCPNVIKYGLISKKGELMLKYIRIIGTPATDHSPSVLSAYVLIYILNSEYEVVKVYIAPSKYILHKYVNNYDFACNKVKQIKHQTKIRAIIEEPNI